jgi:DNA-binding MarR family transcriptional regulator
MSPPEPGTRAAAGAHEDRLIHALWLAHRTVAIVLDEELSSLGLTVSQYGMLNRLVVYGPLSTADLARISGVRPQTAAPVVAGLIKADLVRERRHPVHKRVLLRELTDRGRQVWQGADERVAAIEARLRDSLGEHAHHATSRGAWKVARTLNGLPDDTGTAALWPESHAPGP